MGMSWAYRVPGATLDELSDALTIAAVEPAGISEETGVATAWFAARPDTTLPLDGSWEAVDDADWSEEWKKGLDRVTVGRVTIAPPWLAPEGPQTGEGPITIVIDPGMAFGTGHHETTAGCLGALQELPLAGRHVIDVGTGTGVLALAARALGAARVTAIDNDQEAVDAAEVNIAAHGMDGISLALGSTDVLQGTGDVVLANIITDKLLALLPSLVALVAPGGTLITSGIAVHRTEEAMAAFSAAGLEPVARPGREWTLLIAHAPLPR